MWIISNDHNTLVNLTGTLSVGSNKECYTLIHNNVELGAYKNRGEVIDIIVDIAVKIEKGAKEFYLYEMPVNTYPSTCVYTESQTSTKVTPLSVFGSLPDNVL